MITKLPIVIDCRKVVGFKSSSKIIFHNFYIKKENNNIKLNIINPYNDLDYIKLPCVNDLDCVYYLKVTLPLVFTVYDSKIISPYFFYTALKSKNKNDLDFFYNFIKFYNKNEKVKYNFLSLNEIDKYKNYLIKYSMNFKIANNYNNINSFLDNLFKFTNIKINVALMINYINPNYTNKSFKLMYNNKKLNNLNKILFISNCIKTFKFSYKLSDKFTINNHINNFKIHKLSNSSLKKGNYYFLEVNEKKFLRIKINDIKDGIIYFNDDMNIPVNKYMFYYYHKCFSSFLNKDCLFNSLLSLDLIDVCFDKLFNKKNTEFFRKIFLYFSDTLYYKYDFKNLINSDIKFDSIDDKYLNILSEENLIIKSDINCKLFQNNVKKYKIDIDKNILFLKILFDKYTFPIKYNKRELDPIFEKILYFSLLNYEKILLFNENKMFLHPKIIDIIPIKLKNLYFNILKVYYKFIEEEKINDIIYNYKIYNDYIHYEVFKTIFESSEIINRFFKLKKNLHNKIITTFKKLDILSNLSRNIKWKNLSKKLDYLEILIDNKEYLFYLDKLNKTILPENFDSRIKKIINNPCEMFKYLKNQKDFVKWVYFLNYRVIEFYNITINISEDDYINLGKLIYLLVNIKEQKIDEESYLNFIKFCKQNEKLILYNSRINLKIKDNFKFLDFNINLGYLAKHLTWDKNIKISLSDCKDTESDILKDKIKNISKKYYKYKGKYLRLKKDTSSLEYFTRSNNNTENNNNIKTITKSTNIVL